MKNLTRQQQNIVDYIRSFTEKESSPPSYREIMKHFHWSSLGTAYKHIEALKKKGILEDESGPRSLVLTGGNANSSEGTAEVLIPFFGYFKGTSIETLPKYQSLAVPTALVRDVTKTYALRVETPPCNAPILKNDLLLIETRQIALEGETVLAEVEGKGWLLGRYTPCEAFVSLSLLGGSSLLIPPAEISIQGILIALVRTFQASSEFIKE